MQPLVSILIPVYNHEQYIAECLNALLVLNYSNIEVLICDDGSKDNSYQIIEQWFQKNSQLKAKLFRQKNQGICKTLNRLILESSGQYIALCASDDILDKDSLTKRVELLEADSTKLACIGDATVINEYSVVTAQSAMKTLYGASYDSLQKDIVRELVLRWSVVGPTLLIKRSAYDIVGLYDESLLVEDREFYLRLLSDNTLVFWPQTVAAYRIHQSNISRKSIKARLVVLEQVAISNFKHYHKFSGLNRLFLASHCIDLGILKLGKNSLCYYLLQPFRLLRKAVFGFALTLARSL